MKNLLILIVLFIGAEACAQKNPVTTFILLRHAEKADDGTQDPDLNPEGVERAKLIVETFRDTPIDAIYSTNYKRTRQTVEPLASAKNLTVQPYEAFKNDVIETMLKKHNGGTIVISGHSNNIPWTANLFIGKEEYKSYAESEYNIMLVVSVVEKGKNAKVVRVNYGK